MTTQKMLGVDTAKETGHLHKPYIYTIPTQKPLNIVSCKIWYNDLSLPGPGYECAWSTVPTPKGVCPWPKIYQMHNIYNPTVQPLL